MIKKPIYLLFCFLVFACQKKVETIKPSVESISESIYASGIVKSKNQYQAFASANGIIDKVFITEGDIVKNGTPILTISNETQLLNKENAQIAADFSDFNANQGKLNDAAAAINLAKTKMHNDSILFARQTNLWQQQIGSRVELEQRELAYQNSQTAYSSALIKYDDLKRQLAFSSTQSKKNLQISQKMVGDFTLKSEIDGIVYSLNKAQGEIVSAQTPIAIIGDAKNFVLEMQVDEYDIMKIKKGLSVLVTFDSYKGKVFEAKVTKILPMMNERSKTFLVEAEFTQRPETLYPNITFEANIVLQEKQKALLIPRTYLLNDSLVFKKDGSKVVVKTGLKDYQKIEILSGLGQDDELIKPNE